MPQPTGARRLLGPSTSSMVLLLALTCPAARAQDDSCRYHGDGECDEPQYCAAGTDCSDTTAAVELTHQFCTLEKTVGAGVMPNKDHAVGVAVAVAAVLVGVTTATAVTGRCGTTSAERRSLI